MIVPGRTDCPPKRFTPKRLLCESRPFFVLPAAFFDAITLILYFFAVFLAVFLVAVFLPAVFFFGAVFLAPAFLGAVFFSTGLAAGAASPDLRALSLCASRTSAVLAK